MTSPARKKKKRKAQGWSFTFRPALSHTHTPFGWDELPCFGLALVYVTWVCVCAYALGRRPKMEKTRPLFFLTRGQNKNKNWLEFLFCFGFFSLPKSKERKKERKWRKCLEFPDNFAGGDWTNKREKVYGPRGEIGQFANCAINKFVKSIWNFLV